MKKELTYIAELCQNHNGDAKTLDNMLEKAAELSVQMVMLQCSFSDDISPLI